MQKENMFFFSFPSVRNFDKVKVSANRAKYKKNLVLFLFPRCSLSSAKPKFLQASVLSGRVVQIEDNTFEFP